MEIGLFSPLTVGKVCLSNRIVVSPMCQYSANDGSASDWHLQHLMQLSLGGAALVMVEATAVEKEGRITPYCLGLYSDENEKALKDVIMRAKKVAPHTVFGIQLAHSGRKGSCKTPWEGGEALGKEEGAWQTVAPSALSFDEKKTVPKELTRQEIERIIDSFAKSAKRAVLCGFSVIELHAAHGYLLHEFMSPIANQRKDEFGGDLENRIRFSLLIAEAVRQNIPSSVALGARINATDWVEGGVTLDESISFAKELKKRGVDYVCVSSGGIVPKVKISVGQGYQVPFASKIKEKAQILTRAVGMINTPRFANEVILTGKADFVALARPFLDDPRWGWHAARELGGEINYPPQYQRVSPKMWESLVKYSQNP